MSTQTGSTPAELDKEEQSIIAKDFAACKAMIGADKDKCMDGLVIDYAKTFNSKTEIVRKTTIETHGSWDLVRYTLRRNKLYTNVDVVIRHETFIDSLMSGVNSAGRYAIVAILSMLVGLAL
jgi:hypothetical protein